MEDEAISQMAVQRNVPGWQIHPTDEVPISSVYKILLPLKILPFPLMAQTIIPI